MLILMPEFSNLVFYYGAKERNVKGDWWSVNMSIISLL